MCTLLSLKTDCYRGCCLLAKHVASDPYMPAIAGAMFPVLSASSATLADCLYAIASGWKAKSTTLRSLVLIPSYSDAPWQAHIESSRFVENVIDWTEALARLHVR